MSNYGEHDIESIFDIVLAFSRETNYGRLLDTILSKLMEVTHSDAGTLYTLDGDKLVCRAARNLSLNVLQYSQSEDEPVDTPPIPLEMENARNINAYAALHNEIVVVDDVYADDRFDFSGERAHDSETGYRTQSMLVFPLTAWLDSSDMQVIGIVQLVNAMDTKTGEIIPYRDACRLELDAGPHIPSLDYHNSPSIILVLSNLAAIALANIIHVHEIKSAEAKAREAGRMVTLLLDASPMFMEIWNDELRLTNCNDRFADLFEAPDKAEFMQQYEKFSPECQPCGTLSKKKRIALLRQALEDGSARFEWMHVTGSGEQLPVDTVFTRLMLHGKQIIVGYSHDLRMVKKAMKEMRRIEIAEEENRAKTRFLAQMSHEIRTPLNAILGTAEIQMHQGDAGGETLEAFRRIHDSSHLLLALINNLLDLSKVEAGKMEVNARDYDLAEMIIDVVQLNYIYTVGKQFTFMLKVDPNLPAKLYGDDLLIKQVLNNILSNAFKYTETGTVTLSLLRNFAPSSREGKSGVLLTVAIQDTGQGMTNEQAGQMFTEYARFNDDSEIRDANLGMAIAFRLMKMMDGEIVVEALPGEETCIVLHVPQEVSGEAVLGGELAESLQELDFSYTSLKHIAKLAREPMPYGRVLIVDDMESNLYVAKGLLRPYKLQVETADSGQQCLDKIAAGQVYDIIFMDHMMPGLDGIETFRALRKAGYEHPIVALTANAVVGQQAKLLALGFDGFISKPIDMRLINSCLNKHIRDKQPPEVVEAARAEAKTSSDEPQDTSKGSDELMKHFVRDATRVLNGLDDFMKRQVYDATALKAYVINAHSAKSLLKSIGKNPQSIVAATLEKAGRNSDTQTIKSKTPAFLTDFRGIVQEAARQVTLETVKDDGASEDKAFLREKLAVISKACDAYDKRSAEAAVDALKAKPCSANTRRFFDDIDVLLLRGDFEEAAELATKTLSGV